MSNRQSRFIGLCTRSAPWRFALCLALALMFAHSIAHAQTTPATGDAGTRERRAGQTNGDDSDAAASVGAESDDASDPASAAPKSQAGSGVRNDRIASLRGQISEARTGVERIRLQRTLVDYLTALGRTSEAATELRSMLGTEKLDAASYYNIGNGLARLGDDESAIEAYRKAIAERQGNYPRALNNLGVVLLRQGRLSEAYDALVEAIKRQDFRYAEASYNLGRLYAARDEADLAISEWSRALTIHPEHVEAALALARAYAVTGKPERGLEVIDATLKRTGPNDDLAAARQEILAISDGK